MSPPGWGADSAEVQTKRPGRLPPADVDGILPDNWGPPALAPPLPPRETRGRIRLHSCGWPTGPGPNPRIWLGRCFYRSFCRYFCSCFFGCWAVGSGFGAPGWYRCRPFSRMSRAAKQRGPCEPPDSGKYPEPPETPASPTPPARRTIYRFPGWVHRQSVT